MVRNHRAARSTVINECAYLGSFETDRCGFARLNVSQASATKSSGYCMQIDIVLHAVRRRVNQCQLNIVVLVNNHHRTRVCTAKSHSLNPGICVKLLFYFCDAQRNINDHRTAFRSISVFRCIRWSYQNLLNVL